MLTLFDFLNSSVCRAVIEGTGEMLLVFKGCSGSGKSENLKYALHYLLWFDAIHDHCSQENRVKVVGDILSSTPLFSQSRGSGPTANVLGSYSLNYAFPHECKDGRLAMQKVNLSNGKSKIYILTAFINALRKDIHVQNLQADLLHACWLF